MRQILLAGLLALFPGLLPLAAEELGRAVIGGREIIVEKNGTWRYAAPEPAPGAGSTADCSGQPIIGKMVQFSLCLDPNVWRRTVTSGSFEATFASKDEKIYFGIIPEKGKFDPEKFIRTVIDNAQKPSGMFEVTLKSQTVATFNGQRYTRLAYPAKIEGIDLAYVNYLMLGDEEAFQMIFWSLASDEEQLTRMSADVMASLLYRSP